MRMTQQAVGVMSATIHLLMGLAKLKRAQRRTRIIAKTAMMRMKPPMIALLVLRIASFLL